MTPGPPDLMLLTFARRGEEEAIRQALGSLRGIAPEARVFAVGTPDSAPVLIGLGVDQVIVHRSGRRARGVVRAARARRPEAAAVVYSGPDASGHLKLEMLALAVGPRRLHRALPGESLRPVGRFGLGCSAAAKLARLCGDVLVAALLCAAAFCSLSWTQGTAGGFGAGRA